MRRPEDGELILGSGSPWRKQLLQRLGIPFEVRVKKIDERFPTALQGAVIATHLAALKSEAFQPDKGEIVLTADTVVWHRGKTFGKPEDESQAFDMLRGLSGDVHEVITAVAVKSNRQSRVFCDRAKVYFKDLEPDEIEFYIRKHRPLDKPGAYGVQDWIWMR